MPTIEHHSQPTPPRRRSRGDGLRRAWPVAVPLLVLALVGLRVAVHHHGGHATTRGTTPMRTAERLGTRSFDGLQLEVPAGWATLERTADHVAWGSPDRSHTVTLAATEASLAPLSGIVASVTRESAEAMPDTRPVGRPVRLDLGERAPHGDTAMLARFAVGTDGPRPLEIRQVWRRDGRAGRDVVATWTSSDGAWPVSPASAIPRAVSAP